MIAYMDTDLQIPSIFDRLAIEMIRCFQETDIPEWMT